MRSSGSTCRRCAAACLCVREYCGVSYGHRKPSGSNLPQALLYVAMHHAWVCLQCMLGMTCDQCMCGLLAARFHPMHNICTALACNELPSHPPHMQLLHVCLMNADSLNPIVRRDSQQLLVYLLYSLSLKHLEAAQSAGAPSSECRDVADVVAQLQVGSVIPSVVSGPLCSGCGRTATHAARLPCVCGQCTCVPQPWPSA
jgi:hypothetical protein